MKGLTEDQISELFRGVKITFSHCHSGIANYVAEGHRCGRWRCLKERVVERKQMNLQVNPFTYIPAPKFGDVTHNKKVAAQWAEWRDAVNAVAQTFGKIKLSVATGDRVSREDAAAALTPILKLPTGELTKFLYGRGITMHAAPWQIAEAVKRLQWWIDGVESVDNHGLLEHEQELFKPRPIAHKLTDGSR